MMKGRTVNGVARAPLSTLSSSFMVEGNGADTDEERDNADDDDDDDDDVVVERPNDGSARAIDRRE